MDDKRPAAIEESGRIQQLLDEVRDLAPAPAWERVEELVQRLLAMQAEAFGRLLVHARACGADGALDARLASDDLLSSLLLLHGLHPLPARERVLQALEELRPRLSPRGVRVELAGIDGGLARLRISGSADGAEAAVRRAVEEAAPELEGVEVEAPPGPLVSLRIVGAQP